jgi:cell division protein FtsB
MNVDVGIWGKLSRLMVLLLFVAGVLGVVVWYLPVIRQNEAYRKRILQLNSQLKQEQETARRLEITINGLRNDPKTVERVAREKLGFVKPGDTMIRFEGPPAGFQTNRLQ